ncbi:MAG: hypothetical protein WAJ82_11590, partial [Azonexus sp.]
PIEFRAERDHFIRVLEGDLPEAVKRLEVHGASLYENFVTSLSIIRLYLCAAFRYVGPVAAIAASTGGETCR